MQIGAILKTKGGDVVSVGPHEQVGEVARTLARHRIGAALVRDAAGDILGIVSERDIVRCVALHGEAAVGLEAAHLMTRVLHTATPSTKVQDALGMMTDRRVRHLPVLGEDGGLCGMVSIGDLVKARIDEALHEAEALRHYVETAG